MEGLNSASMIPKETEDQENSTSESSQNGHEEEKSEEYLNFESFTKAILGIPTKEAEEIRKRTPYPKGKPDK
jgi:hypothetical protein